MEAISRALKTYERGGTPEHDPGYGDALRMRLMIALSMERISEFGADAEALQRGRAIDPVLAGEFPGEESDSLALATRGQWAAAAARVDEIAQRNLRHQGAESPFYKYEFAMEMLERMSDPAGNIGFADIERYVSPLASTEDQWADVSTRGSYTEDGALVMAMDRLMRPNAFPDAAQAQALAFRIAELMRVNATQGALSDGAARLAAGDPKLRSLIEQEQGLRFEQNSSRRAFAALSDRLDRLNKQQQPDPLIVKRETNEVAEKEKALRAADGKITQLRRDIASQFPVYRELVAPSIPSPAKLGAVLRPGEVYVNLYAGRKATYAFVVLPGGKFQAQRLDVTRDQVRKMAAALRASFDAGTPPTKADDLGGFDLAASAGLFKALIGPLQASLQGSSTIYLSTSGILSSVPWNVLLTAPATTLADGKWWVASVTPVLIPTASALVLERSQTTKHGSAPFIAFADPSFDGQDHAPADASAGAHTVRERAFRSASAGGQPDLDYRNVAPLPETLEEVRAIGAVLKAPPQNIIRGTQATRTRVLKQDMSDDRVVAFATHGLLPGEVPGMLKAGLALAYEGKGLSDSVLTIDDIVALRLNADWVVLSACNTGFASGNAGDTISALARGFYAAGGRSLLVTQWSVESESAKELTVGLFTAYAADTNLTKASAIAQAQRDMLGGKYGALYRHPYFWGAYFLEGDAGR
jgi:CHAT domain-containing protein